MSTAVEDPRYLVGHRARRFHAPRHGPSPEAAVLAAEAVARVRTAVAALDRNKQELLALRFAAGLTSAQIASVVGKREAGVKKQLWRLVQQLKKDFEDEPLS